MRLHFAITREIPMSNSLDSRNLADYTDLEARRRLAFALAIQEDGFSQLSKLRDRVLIALNSQWTKIVARITG